MTGSVSGIGDFEPQASLRWNFGVHNFMIYATGDAPVGLYNSLSLANVGYGHGAIDGGGGYTYFNEKTGDEFSAVLGFTYNFTNPATQYQNGVDVHLDWSLSKFFTKHFKFGAAGYFYNQASCDHGLGDQLGCFESRVLGVGPQATLRDPAGRSAGSPEPQMVQGLRLGASCARLERMADVRAVELPDRCAAHADAPVNGKT